MRIVPALLMTAFLLTATRPAGSEERREVKCDIQLASASMKAGATGEIILTFMPDEGIHINTDPAMEFEFAKDPTVHFTGITSLPKAPKTGYLDARRPVKYGFTLDKKIRKGKHTVTGTVRYYFCSDAEGWCNRFSQPIHLTFTVTQ